jgi:hypothetical protein
MSETISSVAPAALVSVEQELHRINTTLVAGGQFLEALRQLMLLAVEHAGNAQLWLLVGLVYTRIAHWRTTKPSNCCRLPYSVWGKKSKPAN